MVNTSRVPTRTVVRDTGFQTAGFNRGVSTVNFGFNNRNNSRFQLNRIDRQIDNLRRERRQLRVEQNRTRRLRPSIQRRLNIISHDLDLLQRQRNRLIGGNFRRGLY